MPWLHDLGKPLDRRERMARVYFVGPVVIFIPLCSDELLEPPLLHRREVQNSEMCLKYPETAGN